MRSRRAKQPTPRLPGERLIILATLLVASLWPISNAPIVAYDDGSLTIAVSRGYVVIERDDWSQGPLGSIRFVLEEMVRVERAMSWFLPRSYSSLWWSYALVPFWLILMAATTAIFLVSLFILSRQRQNCPSCGYPIDPSVDLCPECGRNKPSIGPPLRHLAWRAYRWPLACIVVNITITRVFVLILN